MTTELEKLERGERGENPRALAVVMRTAAAAVPTRRHAAGTTLENAAAV